MNNVCRTCLSASNLTSLKDEDSLIDKIKVVASIDISLDFLNYPTTICHFCVDKINEFYSFRKIIIDTDNELRERSKLNIGIKSPSTRKKRICDKSPRKRNKIQSKVISTSTPDDNIKSEPLDDESHLDRLIICESENVDDDKSLILKSEKEYYKKSKSLDCVECNTTFSTLKELSNHKRNLHTAPGICNICGVVVRADNLKKHVQKHSEGPVSCKICSKVLKNSESLRGHLLIHKGTSFECEQCEKTFRLKSEYHRHLKKHIDPNVRKKMCTICGKHVRDMQRHLFTHTGERPYVCKHCNKGLTSSYALKLHIRQHTNEKPYICEFCSKAFAQKISLLAHLKSKIHYGQT